MNLHRYRSAVVRYRYGVAGIVICVVVAALVLVPASALHNTLIVALALVGSLVLGLSLLRTALTRTIDATNAEQRLAAPLLGAIPRLRDRQRSLARASLAYIAANTGWFAESIRALRTEVVLAGLTGPTGSQRVIVVTASLQGEGTTTIATNLAIALGQLERVLLIDADVHRPALASDFGLDCDAPGLAELMAGSAEWEHCIRHDAATGIDVVPAGLFAPQPPRPLPPSRFAPLLALPDERYDRIVIDGGTLGAHDDSLAGAAVLYVVRAASTPVRLARAGLLRLRAAGANIVGVVLNQVD